MIEYRQTKDTAIKERGDSNVQDSEAAENLRSRGMRPMYPIVEAT